VEALSNVLKEAIYFVKFRTMETIIFLTFVLLTPMINSYFLEQKFINIESTYFGWTVNILTIFYFFLASTCLTGLNHFIFYPYRQRKRSEALQAFSLALNGKKKSILIKKD